MEWDPRSGHRRQGGKGSDLLGNIALVVATILVIWGALEAAGVSVTDWVMDLIDR